MADESGIPMVGMLELQLVCTTAQRKACELGQGKVGKLGRRMVGKSDIPSVCVLERRLVSELATQWVQR
jgi:hypothetical protein